MCSYVAGYGDLFLLTFPDKVCFESHTCVFRRFTKDGVLVEGLFWKDVEGLINDYANAKENKKSK